MKGMDNASHMLLGKKLQKDHLFLFLEVCQEFAIRNNAIYSPITQRIVPSNSNLVVLFFPRKDAQLPFGIFSSIIVASMDRSMLSMHVHVYACPHPLDICLHYWNCLGGQKPPRNILKSPRKQFLAANRQAICAKNRELWKLDFLGSQQPRNLILGGMFQPPS